MRLFAIPSGRRVWVVCDGEKGAELSLRPEVPQIMKEAGKKVSPGCNARRPRKAPSLLGVTWADGPVQRAAEALFSAPVVLLNGLAIHSQHHVESRETWLNAESSH